MAKIQLAKKTVAHAHAKCQLWTAQAGGRADGETERWTDDQTISQRPSTGPETQRCRQGEVSLLLLLLRIDSFMFSLSAENQYFSYFLSYFFRFFVLFVIVFEASFRVWASVIISLRVVAPSDSHFSQRTGQDWLAASCLFEKCFWNFNKLVALNGLAHLLGAPRCSLLSDKGVGGTLREAVSQLIDFKVCVFVSIEGDSIGTLVSGVYLAIIYSVFSQLVLRLHKLLNCVRWKLR